MVSFKELPYLAQIAIVALLVMLLAGGAYLFSLKPLIAANDADALTLKSKRAEIAQLMPYKAKLAELIAQTATLQAQMEAQRKIVPEEKEVPTFITVLATEAIRAGVEVRRYTPRDAATKEYYVEVPFEIDVDGPYYAVLNYFDRIQKLERIVNVSHLGMAAIKGGRSPVKKSYKWAPTETVTANAVVTTFYSITKSGPPAPPVKK
jgi:type IV pilus assembly protein PilO